MRAFDFNRDLPRWSERCRMVTWPRRPVFASTILSASLCDADAARADESAKFMRQLARDVLRANCYGLRRAVAANQELTMCALSAATRATLYRLRARELRAGGAT